jgi:co-chaperonin GroES (HSP10)
MDCKPLGKYILITPIDEQVKSEIGLIMSGSDTSKMRYKKGRIVKVGTDVASVSDGDTVYYDKNAGYSMMIGDVTYSVIMERDVIVVL